MNCCGLFRIDSECLKIRHELLQTFPYKSNCADLPADTTSNDSSDFMFSLKMPAGGQTVDTHDDLTLYKTEAACF